MMSYEDYQASQIKLGLMQEKRVQNDGLHSGSTRTRHVKIPSNSLKLNKLS